jgi:hypothetical protein
MLVENSIPARIFKKAQIVISKNIQNPETRIEDQPILTMVSEVTG